MESTPIANVAFLGIVAFIVVLTVNAAVQGSPPIERPKAMRRWILIAMAWLLVTALPTLLGVVAPHGPFPPQLLFGTTLLVAVLFASSAAGGRTAASVPLWALVGFQGFRLPLELVLHRWVEAGVAPPQMTWTGQNPDIIAGGLALIAIPFVLRNRVAAWIPTLVGLSLLLNIGRIVITSLPGPLQRFPDLITIPQRFPHVWIGTICVVAALVGHILAIRVLRDSGTGPRHRSA